MVLKEEEELTEKESRHDAHHVALTSSGTALEHYVSAQFTCQAALDI